MAYGHSPDGRGEMHFRQELGELFSRSCEMGLLLLIRGEADEDLMFGLFHNACKDTTKRANYQINLEIFE